MFRMNKISPADYLKASVLLREVEAQMLARLDLVALHPKRILNMGCGINGSVQLLKQRYPEAEIVEIDYVQPMLEHFHTTQSKWDCRANAALLLIVQDSIDLIVSNLFLPWCASLEELFLEWRRVLRPEGLLMFTSLGPDTLSELHSDHIQLPNFMDMHDLGDALVRAGFADPVLDVEHFSLTYKDPQKLVDELRVTGMIAKNDHLTLLEQASWDITYEVVYAHTWGPEPRLDYMVDDEGIVKIPLAHLRGWKRNRNDL